MDEITPALQRLLNVKQPLLEQWAAAINVETIHRFKNKTDPDGKAWQELSPSYRESKPKNKDRILILEGTMFESLHYIIRSDGFLYGAGDWKAPKHQYGEGVPKREFIGFSKTYEPIALKLGEEVIKDLWDGN